MNPKQLAIAISLLFISISCSSLSFKDKQELRAKVQQYKYDEALSYLEKAKTYKENDNRLLRMMEKGLIEHLSKNYYQSTLTFNKAKTISEELYTVSLSSAAKTLIANDEFNIFYGQTYERSTIYFYLALNHYLLYQQGFYEGYTETKDPKDKTKPLVIEKKILNEADKKRELYAARAEIVAWDSYLSSQKELKQGNSVFKNDLMAKTLGAFIHETIGSKADLGIALQLYKDAHQLVFRNYNSYPTFNTKNQEFIKNFSALPKMKEEDIKLKYINETPYQKDLNDFLILKILKLTKEIRDNNFNKMVSLYKPSKEILDQLKNSKLQDNVTIVFNQGIIPNKIPEKHYYSLQTLLSGGSDDKSVKEIASIGATTITLFASSQLGLLPPPTTYTPFGFYGTVAAAEYASNALAIAFELPKIAPSKGPKNYNIEVFNESGKSMKVLNIPIINPMGDIASQAVMEDSMSRYTRLGARLATKHLSAILAAYLIYQNTKGTGLGEYGAKLFAVGSYLGAVKGIEASESADTRFWSTLPEEVRMIQFNLPKGNYHLKINEISNKEATTIPDRIIDFGEFTINNDNEKKLIVMRTVN